jgi:hypothetical protein
MGEIEEANESSFVVERTPSSKLSYRKYRSGRRMSQEDESEFSRVASGTGALSSSSRSSSRASSASSTNSNRYLELEIFVSRSSDSGHGLRECPQARLDQCLQAPARLAVVESLSSSTRDWTTASAMIVNGFCHAPSRV